MRMPDEYYDYFGDPNAPRDIARSDSVVDDLFIETAAIKRFLSRYPEYHIIVGSKGTGKSLLLFKKAVLATKKSGIVIAPAPPQKAYVPGLKFADGERWVPYWPLSDHRGRPLLVQWAGLWEWALLVSICHTWRLHARRQEDQTLLAELDEVLQGQDQDNPYALIADALQGMAAGVEQFKGKARLPDSRRLHAFMLRHVGSLPPPYVFLDNQDDLFFDYPEFWKASGQGCFLAIQQLQDASNHRIHIFVTLRPEIVWELSKMQHYPQWVSDIFHIQWQDDELIEVLRSRARYLKRELLPSPELIEEDPLHAFLGQELFDAKRNDYLIRVPLAETSGDGEAAIPVRDHILRHTLRRPREMIILGNAVLDARLRSAKSGLDSDVVFREAIDKKASSDIAKPYLAEIKHRWPWGTYPDQSLLHFIVRHLSKNVLSPAEVRWMVQAFADEEGIPVEKARPITQLASLGLIGWPVEDPASGDMIQHFVLPGEQDVDVLPAGIKWFLVHPILYAAPFHIGVVQGNVIGPGLPFHESKQKTKTKYHSAFVRCGPADLQFGRRIYDDLQSWGVRAYFCGDSDTSADAWPAKNELQKRGRLLTVCSVDGLEDRVVLQELDEQAGRAPERIIPLSLDHEWQGADFAISLGGRDLKPFLLNRTPMRFEKDVNYHDTFRQLLKALERGRRSTRPRKRRRPQKSKD